MQRDIHGDRPSPLFISERSEQRDVASAEATKMTTKISAKLVFSRKNRILRRSSPPEIHDVPVDAAQAVDIRA